MSVGLRISMTAYLYYGPGLRGMSTRIFGVVIISNLLPLLLPWTSL